MTPRLVLRPQAEAELLDARDWYEDQRPGLGSAFAAEVVRALGGILQAPLAYPCVQAETRRALVRRFPYAVYFRCPMRSSYLPSFMVDGTLDVSRPRILVDTSLEEMILLRGGGHGETQAS